MLLQNGKFQIISDFRFEFFKMASISDSRIIFTAHAQNLSCWPNLLAVAFDSRDFRNFPTRYFSSSQFIFQESATMTALLRVFSREVYRASCRRDGQLPFACVVGKVLTPRGFATDAKVGSMKFNASKK